MSDRIEVGFFGAFVAIVALFFVADCSGPHIEAEATVVVLHYQGSRTGFDTNGDISYSGASRTVVARGEDGTAYEVEVSSGTFANLNEGDRVTIRGRRGRITGALYGGTVEPSR